MPSRPMTPVGPAADAARAGSARQQPVAPRGRRPVPPPPPRTWLRTAEVADILHVTPKTVYRWSIEGRLPSQRTMGGHRRYPEAEIRNLAAQLASDYLDGVTG